MAARTDAPCGKSWNGSCATAPAIDSLRRAAARKAELAPLHHAAGEVCGFGESGFFEDHRAHAGATTGLAHDDDRLVVRHLFGACAELVQRNQLRAHNVPELSVGFRRATHVEHMHLAAMLGDPAWSDLQDAGVGAHEAKQAADNDEEDQEVQTVDAENADRLQERRTVIHRVRDHAPGAGGYFRRRRTQEVDRHPGKRR